MEKRFNRRMWENVLERHFEFGDVEITEYHPGTFPCDWYGMFTYYCHLAEGAEYLYFFKICHGKISLTLVH